MPAPVHQVARHCYAESIGAEGVDREALAPDLDRARERLTAVVAAVGADPQFDCLAAARTEDDLAALQASADGFRRFDDVVLIGTGGSGLGARALAAIEPPGSGVPRLHVLDNPQPGRLERLLDALDLARTGLLLVSKSGSTAEVLAQALVALPAFDDRLGRTAVAEHVLGVSVPAVSPLRRLADEWGFTVLDHPPSVAGRYSVFTLVGVLPALVLGLDAVALRQGAARRLANPDSAAEGAALMAALMRRGKSMAVHLTYDQRLDLFTHWHAQLWAESLGKDGLGMTPVPALGPLDQHSQLQLYLGGPADKVFTVYAASDAGGTGAPIGAGQIEKIGDLSYLEGRTVGDLVAASARATVETLVAHGRPVRLMLLPRVDEETLGDLFMHYMLETILAADLLGVNPFDQPAVEDGKVRAREYLRSGRVAMEP